MKLLAALALVSGVTGFKHLIRNKSTDVITNKVYVGETAIYGDGAGETAFEKCSAFSKAQKGKSIKVCGNSVSLKVWLRNRCEDYAKYAHRVGSCDTKVAADSCQTLDISEDEWHSEAQSYQVESC